MALSFGTKLGCRGIVVPLNTGGIREVFRARDTKDTPKIGRAYRERLPEVLGDKAVLHIMLPASWFLYIDRLADPLVVGRST